MPIKSRRRRSLKTSSPSGLQKRPTILRLWMLRLLSLLGGHRKFLRTHEFDDYDLALEIGLIEEEDEDESDFDRNAIRRRLQKMHQDCERTLAHVTVPKALADNIQNLAVTVGLTEVDCRLLEFTVLLHTESLLENGTGYLEALDSTKTMRALAVILNIPEPDIRAALQPDGALYRTGLLALDRDGSYTLRYKLSLLSSGFADKALTEDSSPLELLEGRVTPASPPHLRLQDYPHIARYLDILLPYLRHALATRRQGVNVLIHGVPGTGKTQLARTLAQEMACMLYEVNSTDAEGEPIYGSSRMRAFLTAQSFFSRQPETLILFDEVEDVFSSMHSLRGKGNSKAWLNRALEENPIPSLWLTNSISELDNAFIRRFDMVFELPVPPKQQRRLILEDACRGLLDEASIDRFAQSEALAPAVVTRAASVVHSISAPLDAAQRNDAVALLINSTLVAQEHRPVRKHEPAALPEGYDPSFINTDAELTRIKDGLANAQSGRLCLYGPPGTGKTAYGRWIAQQLDKPLILKKVSDLASKWVGETEQNIAEAFEQAEEEEGVLMIDEIDSFLQNRRGSHYSWEISMVNEMLTQLEAFPGIFIASTNIVGTMDAASLRRFDLKVKFDYLLPMQIVKLLQHHCTLLGLPPPEAKLQARLMGLTKVTPGDFAMVARRHRFYPIESAETFLTALEDECKFRVNEHESAGHV